MAVFVSIGRVGELKETKIFLFALYRQPAHAMIFLTDNPVSGKNIHGVFSFIKQVKLFATKISCKMICIVLYCFRRLKDGSEGKTDCQAEDDSQRLYF